MKLIKLNEQHYIVVDDSEIKEGDWFYNHPTDYIGQTLRKEGNFWVCSNTEGFHLLSEAKKITHSTLPNKGMENVNFIYATEVEEAIKDNPSENNEWNIYFDEQGKLKLKRNDIPTRLYNCSNGKILENEV